MTKFRELVEMVSSAVQKKDTSMRLLVLVEKRQAVTMRYLATKKVQFIIELQQFKPFTRRRTELSCTAAVQFSGSTCIRSASVLTTSGYMFLFLFFYFKILSISLNEIYIF
jgi:hypothetical protein